MVTPEENAAIDRII